MSEYIVKCRKFVNSRRKTLIVPDYIDTSKEIVRCRDCRFYMPGSYSHFTCELLMYWAESSDFCAWAERKDESILNAESYKFASEADTENYINRGKVERIKS